MDLESWMAYNLVALREGGTKGCGFDLSGMLGSTLLVKKCTLLSIGQLPCLDCSTVAYFRC